MDYIRSKDYRRFIEENGVIVSDWDKATLIYHAPGMSHMEKTFALLELKKRAEDPNLQRQIIERLDRDHRFYEAFLLRYMIMMFNNMKINKYHAQLIFTSHDLSTMNSDIFRRDEIWFVAKGNHQNSKLYSLVEFKNERGESVRKDAKFDKQYLEGKYGADPYLRKIIDWGMVNG